MAVASVHIDIEIANARRIQKTGSLVTRNILVEIARGKHTDIADLRVLIDEIIISLQRNPHALISLCKLKQVENYLILHCLSTCILNAAYALEQGMAHNDIKAYALGGMLADAGKFRVPKELLFKKTRFTDEEYALIKKHVNLSYALVERIRDVPSITLQAIQDHHERIDGSGYPAGKQKNEISEAGKITCIADVYDALTSDQFHREAEEPTDALRKMMSWSSTHFEKDYLQKFIQTIGIYPAGTLVVLNNGQLSVVIDQHAESLLSPMVRTLYDIKNKQVIQDRQDFSVDAEGLKILTHTKRDQFKINPMAAIG